MLDHDNIDKMIEFLEEVQSAYAEIKQDFELLLRRDVITPESINAALIGWPNLCIKLAEEYAAALYNHNKLQLDYDNWWRPLYLAERFKTPASSKTPKGDIEFKVQNMHLEEYTEWRVKLAKDESRLKLIEQWEKTGRYLREVLVALANNVRAEIKLANA